MSAQAPPTEDDSATGPWISVVITTYDLARYDDFSECVDSVLAQTYDRFDIVLVSETTEVRAAIDDDYAHYESVTHVHLEDGGNLATARNAGAEAAEGDVIAFIDDDAVAHAWWLSELARGYQESNLLGVGGRADPEWVADTVGWLPPEFYWLVGATHEGFATGAGEVRNTFGCNISFDRETFLELGGFNPNLGKDHGHNLQGEETEFCARLRAETGHGIYYVPSATIDHKVYEEQTSPRWLFDRAFWQGVTKAVMAPEEDDATDEEWGFLGSLFTVAIPSYLKQMLRGPSRRRAAVQCMALGGLTGAVGIGFIWGKLRGI